ncbi:hypothetical protein L7F22_065370 [Adiantum nelumboides]|nr:hypothetical protein [Adiantum nelumboides]
MMHGKLCVPKQLQPKVLIECQAPPYAGHRGIDATVKAVDTFFYWPTLRQDVDAFVRSCLVCQMVKFDRQKAPGLLKPLPIPDKPWESIAMGNDGIWTIICRFSKQAHFVPVRKKIKSKHMVKLFMHDIFKYHGMPQSIVSDRGPRMTSLFWKALFENMGTTLKFSSSFHPQTDEQSKEANSTVLDLLKCYVLEHKATWEHYLPLVEYTKDKIFEADKYVQNTDEAYKKIKLAIEKTQSKQKKAADRHRRELVFSLGDWVILRFEKTRLRKMKGKERLIPKLVMHYYGPLQRSQIYEFFWKAIWENIGTRLQFSSSFHPQTDGQSEIANSVFLDLLKSYISDQKTQWERYLPLVEFAYNNTIHSSTGKAPFEIVEGAMKVPPFLSTKDKIFEADEYTRDLDTAFAKVCETLQKSQERQKKAVDRARFEIEGE